MFEWRETLILELTARSDEAKAALYDIAYSVPHADPVKCWHTSRAKARAAYESIWREFFQPPATDPGAGGWIS